MLQKIFISNPFCSFYQIILLKCIAISTKI